MGIVPVFLRREKGLYICGVEREIGCTTVLILTTTHRNMKNIYTKLETGLQKQRSADQATCVCCKVNGVFNLNEVSHG